MIGEPIDYFRALQLRSRQNA